jgi:hypothetical protein
MSDDDRKLRDTFRILRDNDEMEAPPLDAVLHRKRSRRVTRLAPGQLLFLAAAAATIIGALTFRPSRRQQPALTQPVADWQPQSNVLLVSGAPELLTDVPSLKTSVFDSILPE